MNSIKKSFGVILVLFICIFCVQVCFAEEYEYDKLNRVTKITYEDGSYVEYTYDANGNITKVNTVNVNDKSDSSDNTSSDNNENGDTSNDDSSSDESNSNASDGANSDNSNSNSSSDKDNSSSNSNDNTSNDNISNDNNLSGDDSKSDTNTSKDNDEENSSVNTPNNNDNNKDISGNKSTLLNTILDRIINDESNDYVMIESVVPTKDIPDKVSKKEYFEEWLIVYPLTFEELMEKYSGLYESVVVNSPLDKHNWLEYAYTLYYKVQENLLGKSSYDKDNEDDKKYIKIIDYFMVNEFYREYIKFKEKIYELSSYYGEIDELIALEINR